MLAFGLTLLVSVAAAPPPAVHAGGDKLASTYEDASCDPADGGECAEEALVDLLPVPAAILDCESPFIAEMIGSCDLPKPTFPSLHVPTLRTGGNGFVVAARDGATERITIVTPPTSVDAALPLRLFSLAPPLDPTRFVALASTITDYAPLTRLDRPPRS